MCETGTQADMCETGTQADMCKTGTHSLPDTMQQLVRVLPAPHDDHLLPETPEHFVDNQLTP